MNNFRQERIGKEIRKIISDELQRSNFELGEGLISVSSVVVSKDFSHAKIYITAFQSKRTPLEIIDFLNLNKYQFKELIAKKMKLRIIPDLKFYLDDTLDEIEHIQSLIKKVDEQSNEHPHKSK